MKLTAEQQRKAEENMGLVGKVLADKVHGRQFGSYTREDLYQIGCIGLCKAAATDKGGCFSNYAYRLIWNEICNALVAATQRENKELVQEDLFWDRQEAPADTQAVLELKTLLDRTAQSVTGVAAKGIQAIRLRLEGYSTKEIGEKLGVPPNYVTAWEAKAKQALRKAAG